MTFVSKIQVFLHNLETKHALRKHLLSAIPFWIGAAITACIATGYAQLFLFVEHQAFRFYENQGYWCFLYSPLLFILAWLIVYLLSPNAAGSGIPQLMAASELAMEHPESTKSFLGLRVIVTKIISSLLTALGGGAIGREGPTLQIAGSVFYVIRRIVPRSWGQPSLQAMILAGGGAGLAAAFNTPLGGIVYVVEELTKVHISTFRTNLLQSVIVSGLVAQAFLGSYLYLGYPNLGTIDWNATLAALAIGVAVGAAGAFFAKCLKQIVLWRATLHKPIHLAIQAAICGLATAVLILLCGMSTLGSGKELIMSLLFTSKDASFWEGLGRFLSPVVSYGNGGAGGIFAPSLSAGAILASFFKSSFSLSVPLLSILGMVAFLTAVTQTPFTSFVIVLEMTDRHSALFPMMITALLAYMTSKLFSKESFYDFVKERQIHSVRQDAPKNAAALPHDAPSSP